MIICGCLQSCSAAGETADACIDRFRIGDRAEHRACDDYGLRLRAKALVMHCVAARMLARWILSLTSWMFTAVNALFADAFLNRARSRQKARLKSMFGFQWEFLQIQKEKMNLESLKGSFSRQGVQTCQSMHTKSTLASPSSVVSHLVQTTDDYKATSLQTDTCLHPSRPVQNQKFRTHACTEHMPYQLSRVHDAFPCVSTTPFSYASRTRSNIASLTFAKSIHRPADRRR